MPQTESLQVWFKASQFQISSGEDEETNPLCYGKALATWLRGKLIALGYAVEEVIPEDWGWCVMCQRKPFMLWVGCSNIHGYVQSRPEEPPPRGDEVVWSCIVVAEVPLLGRLFKRPDTNAATSRLFAQVEQVLGSEPDVVFVEEP
jgi:hypothetical protein